MEDSIACLYPLPQGKKSHALQAVESSRNSSRLVDVEDDLPELHGRNSHQSRDRGIDFPHLIHLSFENVANISVDGYSWRQRPAQLCGTCTTTCRATNRSRHYQFLQEPPPRPPPASAPCSEALRGAAQIAALRKRKEERSARWSGKRLAPEWSIFELQRSIRRLEQEIANLASITVAEAAVEARKNSWGAWLSSLVYKLVEESEDEKARKERARQEKRIEKDLKERRLGSQQAQLQEEQSLLRKAKDNIDAADLRDDQSIRAVEARTREREAREWLERERVERETAKVERERLAKVWKQQQQQREKEAQEAREALRKQQAEARAGELARQVKLRRRQKALVDELERLQRSHVHSNYDYSSTRQASATACSHDVPELCDEGMPQMSERLATEIPQQHGKGKTDRDSETKIPRSMGLL
ncbi:hypothetical protein LTR33_005241 [Friedmanniomyces endolithicus]|nr:hypothetical protein LTR75_017739 [Friedmanniomyces endolithicus]KAK1080791.1 hypothetical protein LTR33_005241 [Friedmanniomyces endolithicus]